MLPQSPGRCTSHLTFDLACSLTPSVANCSGAVEALSLRVIASSYSAPGRK